MRPTRCLRPPSGHAGIAFLTKLPHGIDGNIFLIVDGHSSHKSAETKKFVAAQNGRLSLFFLPPYSSELNPDERVWKNIKHDSIGRLAARTKDEMRHGIEKAVKRLTEVPEIVRGFFRSPDLAYVDA